MLRGRNVEIWVGMWCMEKLSGPRFMCVSIRPYLLEIIRLLCFLLALVLALSLCLLCLLKGALLSLGAEITFLR